MSAACEYTLEMWKANWPNDLRLRLYNSIPGVLEFRPTGLYFFKIANTDYSLCCPRLIVVINDNTGERIEPSSVLESIMDEHAIKLAFHLDLFQ
jgi:hypothetical protein